MLLTSFCAVLLGVVTCRAQYARYATTDSSADNQQDSPYDIGKDAVYDVQRDSSNDIQQNSPYDIQQCNGDQRKQISDALDEAIRMLQATHGRLTDLYTWFAQNATLLPNDPEKWSAYRTWQTFYERPLQNKTILYSDVHRKALDRIGDIMNLTQAMSDTINGSTPDVRHTLQIFCGTEWLRRTSPDRYPTELQQTFFDNRPSNLIGQDQEGDRTWITIRGMNGTFEEELAQGSQSLPPFVLVDGMAGPRSTVLAVNRQYFSGFWNNTANPDVPTYDHIFADETVDPEEYHIRDLVNNRMSALLIEILSTSAAIAGEGKERQYDPSCKLPGETDPPPDHPDKPNPAVFGFYCAEWLGKNSADMAQTRAQNFMFINIAMYLNNRDWSTGYARNASEAQLN